MLQCFLKAKTSNVFMSVKHRENAISIKAKTGTVRFILNDILCETHSVAHMMKRRILPLLPLRSSVHAVRFASPGVPT